MASNLTVDDDERGGHSGAAALRGHDSVEASSDPGRRVDRDDPAAREALDLVRWELELLAGEPPGRDVVRLLKQHHPTSLTRRQLHDERCWEGSNTVSAGR